MTGTGLESVWWSLFWLSLEPGLLSVHDFWVDYYCSQLLLYENLPAWDVKQANHFLKQTSTDYLPESLLSGASHFFPNQDQNLIFYFGAKGQSSDRNVRFVITWNWEGRPEALCLELKSKEALGEQNPLGSAGPLLLTLMLTEVKLGKAIKNTISSLDNPLLFASSGTLNLSSGPSLPLFHILSSGSCNGEGKIINMKGRS